MDKFAAMHAFVEIVDQGSLSAAAEKLDRSLPTMTRALAALEAQLGAKLLVRTTRRMSLTEEGRAYLGLCRRILADVGEAESVIGNLQAEPQGEIRVTAPVLFGQLNVAPAVTRFLKRYHKVRVDLVLLDRIVNPLEEGMDVAVRIGRLPDSSSIAIPVGQVRRVVCASPALIDQHGTPERPDELSALPTIDSSGADSIPPWRFAVGDQVRGYRIQSAFKCNQKAAAVQTCVDGLGFGQFLSYQVEREVRDGALRVVLEAFEGPPWPVNIVYPDAQLMSARLRVFVDYLKTELRERPDIG